MDNYIYFRIKTKFIRSADLSVYEKAMFMVLLTYKNCKEIFASQSELAKGAGMSRYKAMQVLDSLAKKGYIGAKKNTNHKTVVYQILNKALVIKVDTTVNDVDINVTENDTTCQPQPQVPVNDVDTNKDNTNKDKLIKETIPYKEIISHLNKVSGKTFKHTSRATQEKIKARWNDGHRLEDFIKVIDNYDRRFKCTEFHKYLQPSTLFNGKFDERLQWNDKVQLSQSELQAINNERKPLYDVDAIKRANREKQNVKA